MKQPVLVVMAAGMGSRYGGSKQIDPITDNGEIIMDFSLYDALAAGFKKVIFVIKHEIEDDVKRIISAGAGKHIETEYAFQQIDDLPEGYAVPEGREKPWGTGHAIYAARNLIDGPFAVINADDYYGAQPFGLIYDYLSNPRDDEADEYAMAGYRLKNTLTDNGSVARGICRIDDDGNLSGVDERLKIMKRNGRIEYTEDDENYFEISGDSLTSMNFWGFKENFIYETGKRFPAFLDLAYKENPLKAEYLLPELVDSLIREGSARIRVLDTAARWHGVTYREDKASVQDALRKFKEKGIYPEKLWD